MLPDKLNHVDYHWYVVRTKRHQESKLVELLEKQKAKAKNILEIYAPTHTTVNVSQDDDDKRKPLFAGIVFVLATQHALMSFMKEHSQDAGMQYERKNEEGERTRMCVIPESQMRAFRDYNENYADKVIVLERPYSDYAFNTKTGEPNEIVRVIDRLAAKPSLVSLCKDLHAQGDVDLSRRLAQMTGKEAELVINLVRYERDNPGYVKANWSKLTLRPFLTPTSGVAMDEGKTEVQLSHKDFTEIVRKLDITEEAYQPSRQKDETITCTYYAHIGIMPLACGEKPEESFILFANWDEFLREYFLTAGKANERLVSGTVQAVRGETAQSEKLIESFRNYAPILYKVLTDAGSAVKAVPDFPVGNETLNVLATITTAADADKAKNELINTCVSICKELNTTTHLAIWRRYLRTVWLHN